MPLAIQKYKKYDGLSFETSQLDNLVLQLYPALQERSLRQNEKFQLVNLSIFSIKDKIIEMFPKAEVVPFGSFATQLYLPDGDIDVAVLTNG